MLVTEVQQRQNVAITHGFINQNITQNRSIEGEIITIQITMVLIFTILVVSLLLVIVSIFGKSWMLSSIIDHWTHLKPRTREEDKYLTVSAHDIIILLNQSEITSLCWNRGWAPYRYHGNCLTWYRRHRNDVISGFHLIGCSTVLPVHAKVCLDRLRCLSTLSHWDFSVISSAYLQHSPSGPPTTPNGPPHRPRWDIVRLTIKWACLKWAWWLDYSLERGVLRWLKERWYSSTYVYRRYWHEEENGCCWLLNTCLDCPDWTIYLIRPCQDQEEYCTVSLIHAQPESWRTTASSTLISHSLATKLQSFTTFLTISNLDYQPIGKLTIPDNPSQTTLKFETREVAPSTGNYYALRKETESPEIIPDSAKEKCLVGESGVGTVRSVPMVTMPDDLMCRKQKLNEWINSTTITQHSSHHHIPHDLALYSETQYRTYSNLCAAQIITESTYASNLCDISRRFGDRDQATRATCGWSFSHTEKDVLIMKKHDKNTHSGIFSFVGKGLVQSSPRSVCDALRNPRTRFMYDNTLKQMDILHDFGNGLEVVYMQHEVNTVFRSETRDFCVLHGVKVDGERYILTISSIDWLPCPVKANITRGQFLSSGWLIEPTFQDGRLLSMVTYLSQMNLKTTNSFFVKEIAYKQPLAIAHLRQLLASHGGLGSREN